MRRLKRATSGKYPRWLTGTYRGLSWCAYWQPGPRRLEVMFHRLRVGRFERWKVLEWGAKEMAKRLSAAAAGDDGASESVDGGELKSVCPLLCGWLLDGKYDDGTVKGKTRLQIERRGRQVVCVLKDADSGLCLTTCHERASDALLTMELLLNEDDCPWTLDPWPLQKGRRRGKK